MYDLRLGGFEELKYVLAPQTRESIDCRRPKLDLKSTKQNTFSTQNDSNHKLNGNRKEMLTLKTPTKNRFIWKHLLTLFIDDSNTLLNDNCVNSNINFVHAFAFNNYFRYGKRNGITVSNRLKYSLNKVSVAVNLFIDNSDERESTNYHK